MSINYMGILTAVSAVLIFLFGAFILIKGKQLQIRRTFFIFTFTIFTWLFFYSLAYMTTDRQVSHLLFRLGYVGVTIIPLSWYNFTINFLSKDKKPLLRLPLFIGSLLALVFAILIFADKLFITRIHQYTWGYYPQVNLPAHIPFIIYFCSFFTISLMLLFFSFWQSENISSFEKVRRKYVFTACVVGTFAAIDFIPNYDMQGFEVFPAGSIFMIMFCLITAHTIVKYHLMEIRIVITRTGIFLALYTAMFGLPFYLGYRTKSWVLSTSFAFVFGTIGPIIFRGLQKKAEDMLLFQQRRYQRILLQTAGGMVKEHRINRLFNLIVYMIKKEVRVKFAVIFSYDKTENIFIPAASRGYNLTDKELVFHERSLFVKYLKKTPQAVIAEEMPAEARMALGEKLKASPFALLIPSLAGSRLLSFLVLGEKEDKSPYSQDDINVFNILSRQTALAIENCLFFEEFKKVQEQLFQAEKLASIGGIADGVAHQIKNRLNHFSLASGEIKFVLDDFVKNNPEFTREGKNREMIDYLNKVVASITSNVKRTDDIIRGILNYARTEQKDVFFNECRLEEMINAALDLLAVKHALANPPVKINLNSVGSIWGVRVQLNEVFYNFIDNAYESTNMLYDKLNEEERKRYRGEISIEARQESDHWLIIISDNGIGIKDKDRSKMFVPFFTTKSSYKSGSGIGMYVAKRIIEENHKGEIWFESEYLKGTSFFIKIPFPEKSS